MLSYKSNSISTIVPSKVSESYPQFIEFMESYYEWALLSTFLVKEVIGNFDIAEQVQSLQTELNREILTVVESERSFIVNLNGSDTFINDEGIWAYRPHTSPIPISFNELNEYVFCEKTTNDISIFRGQTYYFTNNTGAPFYIKSARSFGTSNQFPNITGNGASSGTITFTVSSVYPDFLYFVTPASGEIGTIRVLDVPSEFAESASANASSFSALGFSKIDNILFHTEYLYESYDKMVGLDVPNAMFERFLDGYGLDRFFKNNFKNRRFFDNFTEFFKKRGSEDGIRFFFRNFFDQTVSFDYPGERVLRVSDSDYFSYDEMYVRAEFGEELIRNDVLIGQLSNASATIEARKFLRGQDYYKLFLNADKRQGDFILGEPLLVLDNDDSSIQHNIEGRVLGTIEAINVIEPGNEYTSGSTISDTYTIAGVTTTVSLTVDAISSAEINRLNITNSGAGYETGDMVYFPTPEKRVEFGAIVQSQISPNTIAVDIEDYSLYEPIDFVGASFNIKGTFYDVIAWSGGSPDTITVESRTAIPVPPSVKAGQLIVMTADDDNVTDPFYDQSGTFFHPNRSVVKRGAYGRVTASGGAITDITMLEPGTGYIKRPTTANGGITIITTSGTGADINVIGQGFGGVVSVTREGDIVGPEFNSNLVLDKGGDPDDNAVLELVAGVHSKYGQFFESNKGFLSDEIYLHDSFFYQDYSYVIQSDLNLAEFGHILKQLSHPAGMIFFNQFFLTRIFRQRLNQGSDIPNAPKTIFIEKFLYTPFSMDANLTIAIQDMLVNVYTHQLRDTFHWASSSILELESTYQLLDDPTISGTTASPYLTVSGYQDVILQSGTPIERETDETHFVSRIYATVQETISGVGTISYSDTSSGEAFSQYQTMTGTGTSFFDSVAYDDMIYAVDETFYVRSVDSDTQLTVQRLNTSDVISFSDEPYTIGINRRTELDNARLIDVLYFGDTVTISGHLTDTWQDFLNTVYIT